MRLFIAINFNNSTKSRLARLRDELKGRSSRGTFPPDENLHITLAFLGECDEKQAASVRGVMDSVAVKPFDIAIDRVGCFRRNGGDIWWAGARESRPLAALQRELTDKLINRGFDLDKREYSPHITLGRRVETDERPRDVEPFVETIYSIDLMKSDRVNGRMIYKKIYKMPKTSQF